MADTAPDRQIADMDGSAALPRKNGELVFEDAWEGRIFGMAVAMADSQRYDWEEFRQRLIAEIGTADAAGSDSTYYQRWLAAFERLLLEKALVSPEELSARLAQFESGERDDVF